MMLLASLAQADPVDAGAKSSKASPEKAATSHDAQAKVGPWNKADLFAVPKNYPSDQVNAPGVKSLMYTGLDYKGKETRFYAYYGVPEGKAPESGWPAVVLVHGGGGTASTSFVNQWVKRGYAAISMDLEGHLPKAEKGKRLSHEWSGPHRFGAFNFIEKAPDEQWFYHAVAGITRAHSLLLSFPDIDKNRTGINGYSWGGILTSVVTGIDDRFKFGICNTGCGFLFDGDSYLGGIINRRSPEMRQRTIDFYDGSSYLPKVKYPMLWTTGTIDVHFPIDICQKSALATKGESTFYFKVGLGHAARPNENLDFADSVLQAGIPLAKRGKLLQDGKKWATTFTSKVKLTKADLSYTTSEGERSKRKWKVIPADLKEGTVSAKLPEGTTAFFFSVTDEKGRMVSSLYREL